MLDMKEYCFVNIFTLKIFIFVIYEYTFVQHSIKGCKLYGLIGDELDLMIIYLSKLQSYK